MPGIAGGVVGSARDPPERARAATTPTHTAAAARVLCIPQCNQPFGPPVASLACAAQRLPGEVAQLVEHTTENRGVVGSIPTLATCGPLDSSGADEGHRICHGQSTDRQLGRDHRDRGPRVRRLGFGAMRITGDGIWGPPADPDAPAAAAAPARARGQPDRHRRLLRARGEREADRRGTAPLPRRPGDRHQGRLLRDGPGSGARDGRPEHLREACEGCLRRLQRRAHRPLPAPRARPQGALRGVDRRAGRAPGRGQDPPHRRLQRRRSSSSSRRAASSTVVSVQNRYNLADRAAEPCSRLRARGHRLHPLVPARAGELAEPGGAARRDRRAPRRDPGPGRPRLAAAPLPGRCSRSPAPPRSSTSRRTSPRPRSSSSDDEVRRLSAG